MIHYVNEAKEATFRAEICIMSYQLPKSLCNKMVKSLLRTVLSCMPFQSMVVLIVCVCVTPMAVRFIIDLLCPVPVSNN